jgi:hypothetical protein
MDERADRVGERVDRPVEAAFRLGHRLLMSHIHGVLEPVDRLQEGPVRRGRRTGKRLDLVREHVDHRGERLVPVGRLRVVDEWTTADVGDDRLIVAVERGGERTKLRAIRSRVVDGRSGRRRGLVRRR